MPVNASFWAGKRVLLTGHTGFKGSWLSLWLQAMGAQVCGLALPPDSEPSLYTIAGVEQGMMSSHMADIRDAEQVWRAVNEGRPQIILHLAAQALVRESYHQPVATYATNVMGTVHVLEAARRLGAVRAVVNVTTDKCYDNQEWLWGYRETEPLGGRDPYSSSKACAELVTSAYRHSFLAQGGTALASARAGNVIGGGDWARDRLVPDILHAMEHGHSVLIRQPRAVRPWQHVLEPLCGYLMLAERLYEHGAAYAQAWNFGPRDEDARPVSWIVERLASLWGHAGGWHLDAGQHPHEAHTLKLDISRARVQLGWQPRWTLDESLEHIVSWHRAWLRRQDMRDFCLAQIQRYVQATSSPHPL